MICPNCQHHPSARMVRSGTHGNLVKRCKCDCHRWADDVFRLRDVLEYVTRERSRRKCRQAAKEVLCG